MPHAAFITGGAAKSIQLINVAAVAAAGACGGVVVLLVLLPLNIKKTACVAQNSSFSLSFVVFFWQKPSFSHVHVRPEPVQRQGRANENIYMFSFIHAFCCYNSRRRSRTR